MELRVPAQKMRRLIAAITNPIGASMWAAGRLAFLGAIIALAARRCGRPRDAIANAQWLVRPILFQTWPELLDFTHGLVAQDNRQVNRQFSFPKVYVRPTDSCHFRFNKRRALLQLSRQGILPENQRGIKALENGGLGARC